MSEIRFTVQLKQNQPKEVDMGGGGHVQGWRTAEGAGRVRSSLLRGNL